LLLGNLLTLPQGPIGESSVFRPRGYAIDEPYPTLPHLLAYFICSGVEGEIESSEKKQEVDCVVRPTGRLPWIWLVNHISENVFVRSFELFRDELNREGVSGIIDEI
jgi:hypothetical protein